MIARVVVLPAAGDTGPLDYRVAESQRPQVQPGVRVLVPLRGRRAVGIVAEVGDSSSFTALKTILSVLDEQPVLDSSLLGLCRWMADYYLCSFAEAVSNALPGSVRLRVDRLVRLAEAATPAGVKPPAEQGTKLSPTEAQVLESLHSRGPQTTGALQRSFGTQTQRALATLQKKGRIVVDDRLHSGNRLTKRIRYYRVARALEADEEQLWRKKRPAQFAVFHYLERHPLRRAADAELRVSFPNLRAKLNALTRAGLVHTTEEETYRPVLPGPTPEDRTVAPTVAQQRAIDAVTAAVADRFQAFLLWGVTGSGKTEVYLRSVGACLVAECEALVLVPEISLTHQLVDRIRARFGSRVAVLHSGLSDGERWDEWRKIARGEATIVVGARSAAFAPLPRLGLVVVDEEHDSAYKQEDGIRYNGRDVAVMRAKLAGCPVLLGSATPAMETFHNGRSGRYKILELPERVEARPLPAVDVVDLRRVPSKGKSVLISPRLVAALQANLTAGGQSLVFLNRRGFANFLQCHQCGDTATCPNCSVTLTIHWRWRALRCHHCEHTLPIPTACPSCASLGLGAWGAGTEQVEAALRRVLPGARIGRMDRDTTSRKGAQRDILLAWERRDYDILVGTQMITKGHDVPGVTLVGVLLADLSLNLPDFRAAERTFQLITQVAGRAGRGERPGRVLVQTLQPQHFSLQCATHHDYAAFAEHELAARRELGYPPFARLVLLRCEGEHLQATEGVARDLAQQLHAHRASGVTLLGPTPAPLEKLRRRYRWQMLLRGSSAAAVHRAAAEARGAVRPLARRRNVRVLVDVDPYSML
jgi:primosomal protein N' (replication factor Y)